MTGPNSDDAEEHGVGTWDVGPCDNDTADNSEWRQLCETPDSYTQAVAALLPIRTTLEQANT